jgi:hypothetical protein
MVQNQYQQPMQPYNPSGRLPQSYQLYFYHLYPLERSIIKN